MFDDYGSSWSLPYKENKKEKKKKNTNNINTLSKIHMKQSAKENSLVSNCL